MSKRLVNLLLVAAIAVIFAGSFIIGGRQVTAGQEGFGGADAQATETIQQINPDYQPWFESVFVPNSGEVESGLFALQAGLGGIALGYCFGALRRTRKEVAVEVD